MTRKFSRIPTGEKTGNYRAMSGGETKRQAESRQTGELAAKLAKLAAGYVEAGDAVDFGQGLDMAEELLKSTENQPE